MNRLLYATAAIAAILSFYPAAPGNAAVPDTLGYQGYLTDATGTPVNGGVVARFSIYTTELGGTALWTATSTMAVDNGLFSVQLGAGNSFPPGMFDTALYLGVAIDSDAEMLPRRPLTAVGFAFEADNALSLQGYSPSAFDQSGHVSDTTNPHGITTAQIGAANADELSAHKADTANPHSLSPTQIGAASRTDLLTHAASSQVHHTRYTHTEAVAAMGPVSDTNPLNHERLTETNIVSAMLANDGPGSTLDSDKLDGLQATELIEAAQDEVRTAIDSLPYAITASGSYYLVGDLDGSSGGLNIVADRVTVDMMGFTIYGGGVDDHGIEFSGQSNIVVRNGFITNFGRAGAYQGNPAVSDATIIDVQALGNGTLGNAGIHSGIFLNSRNSHIERCTAGNNGGSSITAGAGSRLIDNIAYGSGGLKGISSGAGSILTGNVAHSMTSTYAISAGAGSRLAGNTAYDNSSTYALYGNSGVIMIGNTAYDNEHWGLFGSAHNLIENNALYYNNRSDTADQGGLRVGSNSYVTGNIAASNLRNNIYVAFEDNIIEHNVATNSTNGVYFDSASGNFFADNKASGNTNGWVNEAGQINGGGNYDF